MTGVEALMVDTDEIRSEQQLGQENVNESYTENDAMTEM
jgi:hypothetical protein